MKIIEWDSCNKSWNKNFRCILIDSGRWDRGKFKEVTPLFGKWIFKATPIDASITAPTLADQRNFFTGLLEVEWLNDNFINPFTGNPIRLPQRQKKIEIFKKFLQRIEERKDIKDTEHSLNYYIEKANEDLDNGN